MDFHAHSTVRFAAAALLTVFAVASVPAWAQGKPGVSYAHCDPFCVEFRQIGDQHMQFLVDSDGQLVGMSILEDQTLGRVLTSSKLPPIRPGDMHQFEAESEGPRAAYAGSCGGNFVTYVDVEAQYQTRTHLVVIVRTTIACSAGGNVVEVYFQTYRTPL